MIDYSINPYNILIPSGLLGMIAYFITRLINGTVSRVKELEDKTVKKDEYGKDCQILRDDIGKLDLKMALFYNNFLPGGGIYKAFQDEIQKTIKSNAYILGQRE